MDEKTKGKLLVTCETEWIYTYQDGTLVAAGAGELTKTDYIAWEYWNGKQTDWYELSIAPQWLQDIYTQTVKVSPIGAQYNADSKS